MFLLLTLFLTGSHGLTVPVTVKENQTAFLPCPQKTGDVTWSRFFNGRLVTLVDIRDGVDKTKYSQRYSSLADNSLVVLKVTSFDATMYFCNKAQIYLDVTTDAKTVVTPRDRGLDLEPDPKGPPENPPENPLGNLWDLWKVVFGVVAVAVAVILVALTLRLRSRKTTERRANAETEVVYAEIPETWTRTKSCLESPYEWKGVGTSKRDDDHHVYETGNYRPDGESVYCLAGNPENIEERDDGRDSDQ